MQEEDMPNTQMDEYNKQKEHKDLTWFTNRISSHSKDRLLLMEDLQKSIYKKNVSNCSLFQLLVWFKENTNKYI